MSEQTKKSLQIEYDIDMDRFYIPVNSRYEIQTKGKGSSFRIANTSTHIRNLVADEHLHEMIEDMARGTNAELLQSMAATAEANKRIAALEGEVAELKERIETHIAINKSLLLQRDCLQADVYKYQVETANMSLEIMQLQANNHDLREALECLFANDSEKPQYVVDVLSKTPAQSLQAHENSVIEKCANVATDACLVPPDGGTPMSYEVELCDAIAEAIRALKEVK